MSATRLFQDLLPASALDGSSLSLPELRKFCRECRLCASNQSPEKNSQMASPSSWRTRSQLWKPTVFWSTRANAGRKKIEKTENRRTEVRSFCAPLEKARCLNCPITSVTAHVHRTSTTATVFFDKRNRDHPLMFAPFLTGKLFSPLPVARRVAGIYQFTGNRRSRAHKDPKTDKNIANRKNLAGHRLR